ncbi:MAG: methionyl-tRNA formyltransferase [Campylobacterales bacterium]
MKRVIFFGSPEYGLAVLRRLAEEFQVVAVYTQPDRPVGRKGVMTPTPVKKFAEERGIPVFTPTTLKGEGERLRQLNPDFLVVAAYGLLLPTEVLKVAPPINLHGSLLPKYRGASPVQQAILNRDWWTGVTGMEMVERLDAGPMLGWSYTEVGEKRVDQLMEELGEMAGELAVEILNRSPNIKPVPQVEGLASYTRKVRKEDGLVSFSLPAEEIWVRWRAYYRWPSIFTPKFKLMEIGLESRGGEFTPGEILEVDSRNRSGVVGCRYGKIRIYQIQPVGRRVLKFADFLNGARLGVGDILPEK